MPRSDISGSVFCVYLNTCHNLLLRMARGHYKYVDALEWPSMICKSQVGMLTIPVCKWECIATVGIEKRR